MDCCNNKTLGGNKTKTIECPKCGEKGDKVGIETPRNLLKNCCVSRIEDSVQYRYCKNSECEVSYFSSRSDHFFKVDELRVRATVKDKSLDVNVCYCFGHTRQTVMDEINETGDTNVLADIKAKMKDPGCFCETSNPQGQCCLGNVKTWVKEAKEKA